MMNLRISLCQKFCVRGQNFEIKGARCSDRVVSSPLCFGDALGRMAASLDGYAPTRLFTLGFPFDAGISAVGIDIAAGVARGEHSSKRVVTATAV